MKKLVATAFAVMLAVLISGGATKASADTVHTVQYGDTFWKIAVKYQVGTQEIIDANPQIANPNWIYPGQKINIPTVGEATKSFEQQVVDLVNKERTKQGLSPLKENWELSRVARFKSEDMRDRRYFSHDSPTYGSPFQMMKDFGLNYRTAGENIAAGQRTPEEVMKSWMNSSGHRANILDPKFKEIGVGYAEGGSYGTYWTQMFMSR